jgi:hypothetical protein
LIQQSLHSHQRTQAESVTRKFCKFLRESADRAQLRVRA